MSEDALMGLNAEKSSFGMLFGPLRRAPTPGEGRGCESAIVGRTEGNVKTIGLTAGLI